MRKGRSEETNSGGDDLDDGGGESGHEEVDGEDETFHALGREGVGELVGGDHREAFACGGEGEQRAV